jgi:hypothetical protein
VAVLGILALGYLAVENWTFGFERVVDLRLKPVNAAARDLQRAEAELSRLKDQRSQIDGSRGQKRDELRTGISLRAAGIAEMTHNSATNPKCTRRTWTEFAKRVAS